METVVERPGALDVHKAQVTACVRVPADGGGREQHVVEFSTTVAGLLTLRDWLTAHGVTQVTMEATGVYWKPVWAILEDEFECLLVNARHVKQVPGRKTDVKDAEWLCQLAEAGLLKASFVPPKPIRALRNLTRYRKTQIQERSREANRLHKALEDTGIKLDCVASDILGVSGRAMLDALVAGKSAATLAAYFQRPLVCWMLGAVHPERRIMRCPMERRVTGVMSGLGCRSSSQGCRLEPPTNPPTPRRIASPHATSILSPRYVHSPGPQMDRRKGAAVPFGSIGKPGTRSAKGSRA
jgi:Transposase